MASEKFELYKKQFIAELKRDKKKATILAVLSLVCLFVGGRILFKGGPAATANASVAAKAVTSEPASTAPTGGVTFAMPARPMSNGEPAAELRLVADDEAIKRDLFAMNPDFFPPVEQAKAVKSLNDPKEAEEAKRKALRTRVENEASKLHLEGTIAGASPIAIINGKVVQVNEWISGFEVTGIDTGSCMIAKEGIQLKLIMKQ